jgi:hypothetical protein
VGLWAVFYEIESSRAKQYAHRDEIMNHDNGRVLQFKFDVIDLGRMRAESYLKMANPALESRANAVAVRCLKRYTSWANLVFLLNCPINVIAMELFQQLETVAAYELQQGQSHDLRFVCKPTAFYQRVYF